MLIVFLLLDILYLRGNLISGCLLAFCSKPPAFNKAFQAGQMCFPDFAEITCGQMIVRLGCLGFKVQPQK